MLSCGDAEPSVGAWMFLKKGYPNLADDSLLTRRPHDLDEKLNGRWIPIRVTHRRGRQLPTAMSARAADDCEASNGSTTRLSVLILGGIFDKPASYRRTIDTTPEVALAKGLADAGLDVTVAGLRSALPRRAFDIVHLHHVGRNTLVVALRSTRWANAMVFTPHRIPTPFRRHAWVERLVLAKCDALIALSEAELALHRRHSGRLPGHCAVIPNAIDPLRFPIAPALSPGPPWRLLFVGHLTREKGADRLVQAVHYLRTRSMIDVSLKMIYNHETLAAKIKRYLDTNNLTDAVQLRGAVPNFAMQREYAASHFLTLPSLEEALPSVITESILTGRPVLAPAIGGAPEQIGCFGRVVAPDASTTELASLIAESLAAYPRYVTTAAEARSRILRTMSLPVVIEQHLSLYGSIMP